MWISMNSVPDIVLKVPVEYDGQVINLGKKSKMSKLENGLNKIFGFLSWDYRIFFLILLWWSWVFFFAFQYDNMGKNQTAVREEMISLANYLDSVSLFSISWDYSVLSSHSLWIEF